MVSMRSELEVVYYHRLEKRTECFEAAPVGLKDGVLFGQILHGFAEGIYMSLRKSTTPAPDLRWIVSRSAGIGVLDGSSLHVLR